MGDFKSLIYRSGDVFFPPSVVAFLNTYVVGDEDSLYYINYWSIMHLLSGIIVRRFITRKLYTAIIIHTIWEIWQLAIGMSNMSTRGIIDILNDTLFFIIGFYLFSDR